VLAFRNIYIISFQCLIREREHFLEILKIKIRYISTKGQKSVPGEYVRTLNGYEDTFKDHCLDSEANFDF
jgi:hypothetical protein